MCLIQSLKVKQLNGKTAIMEDGRTVRIGPIPEVRAGDYLEVYGDVALGKQARETVITQRYLFKHHK